MSTPTITRFSRHDPPAHIVEAIDQAGVVMIDDLIDHEQVEAILSEVGTPMAEADPEMTHINDVLQTFYAGVRNVTGLAGRSPTFISTKRVAFQSLLANAR